MDSREARIILGVGEDASLEEIKRNYRFLIKTLHPDKLPKDSEAQSLATQKLSRINFAWELLKNEEKQFSENYINETINNGEIKYCELCAHFPAIQQNVAYISTVKPWKFLVEESLDGIYCGACGESMCCYAISETLTKGWWSPFGLLNLPFTLFWNLKALYLFRQIGYPTGKVEGVAVEEDEPLPKFPNPIFMPKVLLSTFVAIPTLYFIVNWGTNI